MSDAFVVVGSGPSLTEEDCIAALRARDDGLCKIIAVNDAYRMIGKPDILYACDYAWWRYHCQHHTRVGEPGVLSICPDAARYSGEIMAVRDFGCTQVNLKYGNGLAPEGADYVMQGHGSGFHALGLAIKMGGRRIALLGMDCKRASDGKSHYFGDHPRELPNPQPFDIWAQEFVTVVEPARQRGIEIVNCTRDSAIPEVMPRMTIRAWVELLRSEVTSSSALS